MPEGKSHHDVSRLYVRIVVVIGEIAHHALAQVAIALLELEKQHAAVVRGEHTHPLVIGGMPGTLGIHVVEHFVKINIDGDYIVFHGVFFLI